MKPFHLKNCPGTLAAGYNTYSPTALRRMFDNKKVSHILDFSNDGSSRVLFDDNIGRISISGVQEKLSAIMSKGKHKPTLSLANAPAGGAYPFDERGGSCYMPFRNPVL